MAVKVIKRPDGQDWWTLGFEAAGPGGRLRSALQLSCSLRPCPAARNPARMNPGPTRSGCASGPAPRVTPTPEERPIP